LFVLQTRETDWVRKKKAERQRETEKGDR
jgi:hypothetical protein